MKCDHIKQFSMYIYEGLNVVVTVTVLVNYSLRNVLTHILSTIEVSKCDYFRPD